MKKALITGAITLTAFGVSAQSNVFDNPDNRPYLGVRLALDVTCPGQWKIGNGPLNLTTDLTKPSAGVEAGVVYNLPLWKNLYFEPGFYLYYDTYGLDVTIMGDENDFPLDLQDNSVRKFGFRIPAVFGYHFDFSKVSLAVFTGPVFYLGIVNRYYLTSNKINGVYLHESGSMYEKDDEGDSILNRCNLSWRFGVGANYNNFMVSLSGDVGMLNMTPAKYVTYKENNFHLTIGYNF